MSEEKSLGQIARESYLPLGADWEELPIKNRQEWESVASAVASEVRRRDGEKQLPLIPKPEWVLSLYESVAAMAMQGLLANPTESFVEASPRQIAEWAIEQADAFFAEAQKRRGQC